MALPTLPGERKQEDTLNPGQQHSDRRFNDIARAEEEGNFNDSADNYDQDADGSQQDANIRKLKGRESEGDQDAANTIQSSYTGANNKSSKSKFTVKNAKKFWPLFVGGGGVGIIGALFLALLPFKLEMFIQNITQAASSVPGYAIERRTEYMATNLLAVHLLKKSGSISANDSDVQAKMVFCKGASISCSLLSTYGANYFDKIIDVQVGERIGNNVKMTLTPKGQTQLGGNARSWTMEIQRDFGDGQFLNTQKEITKNKDAKKYVKNLVNKNFHTKNVATRFLARQILMKKYGITHWRAFEKTSNKLSETKTKIKTSVLKNTVGKVSSKMSLYLGCFSDASVCDSLKDGLNDSSKKIQGEIDALKDSDAADKQQQIERLTKKKDAVDKVSGAKPLSEEDLAGGVAKDILMKRLLTVVGAAGAIGAIDLVFSAVGAVDSGALEQVTSDMAKTA